MEKSIEEIRDAVQSSLISTNKKISAFKTQEREIEGMIDNVLASDSSEDQKRVERGYWTKRLHAIGLSAAYLLFAANQLNAALNSLESAENHVKEYKSVKRNE